MDGARPRYDLNFAQSGGRHRRETVEGLYAGFREAGIDFVVYLPDATLDGCLLVNSFDVPASKDKHA